MKNRLEAMKWWHKMSSAQKTQICDTETELVGSVKRWETLTGREIEQLFDMYQQTQLLIQNNG